MFKNNEISRYLGIGYSFIHPILQIHPLPEENIAVSFRHTIQIAITLTGPEILPILKHRKTKKLFADKLLRKSCYCLGLPKGSRKYFKYSTL